MEKAVALRAYLPDRFAGGPGCLEDHCHHPDGCLCIGGRAAMKAMAALMAVVSSVEPSPIAPNVRMLIQRDPVAIVLGGLALTLAAAAVSWHLVEQPLNRVAARWPGHTPARLIQNWAP